MHKIYISASEKDREACETLDIMFSSRKRRGIVQVLTGLNPPSGVEWRDWRLSAIGNASCVIVLISEYYVSDDWLYEKELKAIAAARSINNARVILIPTHKACLEGILLSEYITRNESEIIYFSEDVALKLVQQFQ